MKSFSRAATVFSVLIATQLIGCGGDDENAATGGTASSGGSSSPGGSSSTSTKATGGKKSTGGATSTGGAASTGGSSASASSASGGASTTGGVATTGGASTTGGALSTGGSMPTGGATSTGGMSTTGGTVAGGASATGGSKPTGGVTSTGTSATGGAVAGASSTGGSTSTTGGTPSTGGTSASATGGNSGTGGSSATGGSGTPGGASAAGGTTTVGGATATGGVTSTGGISSTGGSSSISGDLAILAAKSANCSSCAVQNCGKFLKDVYGTGIDQTEVAGSCFNTTVAALNQTMKVGTYQPASITPTPLVAGAVTNGTVVCLDVLACTINSGCASAGVTSKCFCGDAVGSDCVDSLNYPPADYFTSIGFTTPAGYSLASDDNPSQGVNATGPINGACFIENIDGRNSTSPSAVSGGFGNVAFALGPANWLVTCLQNNSCTACFE